VLRPRCAACRSASSALRLPANQRRMGGIVCTPAACREAVVLRPRCAACRSASAACHRLGLGRLPISDEWAASAARHRLHSGCLPISVVWAAAAYQSATDGRRRLHVIGCAACSPVSAACHRLCRLQPGIGCMSSAVPRPRSVCCPRTMLNPF
jgi:hypothetical protein